MKTALICIACVLLTIGVTIPATMCAVTPNARVAGELAALGAVGTGGVDRREVEPADDLADEGRWMALRKPAVHVRRQRERLVRVVRPEVFVFHARHAIMHIAK